MAIGTLSVYAWAMAGDPAHNVAFELNDYLFVRSVPEWDLYKAVAVAGQVKYPGTYTIQKGETLSSLIARAGGYTDRAYLRGATFTRSSVSSPHRSPDSMATSTSSRIDVSGSAS